MGNSLFDQLQKVGLVDEQRAKKVKQEKHKSKKQKSKKGAAKGPTEAQKLAQQAKADKAAKDRELEQQRKQAGNQKAIAAQIKQLVEQNRITERDGEIAYNFTAPNGKIKRIYVNEEVHKQLGNGRLIIVNLNGVYELVPAPVADKIKERDEKCVIPPPAKESDSVDEDDPYADYKVPDDLMW